MAECPGRTEGRIQFGPCEIGGVAHGVLYKIVYAAIFWFNFLPLIAAMLMSLPFINEIENGTYRLALTQGIARRRWMLSRVGLTSTAGVAFAAIFSIVFGWWTKPIEAVAGKLGSDYYDLHGTVPVGYSLFAIGLFLALGLLLKRTVPTIFVGFIAYLAMRVPVMIWARQNLVAPLERIVPVNSNSGSNTEWYLSSYFIDAAGNRVSDQMLFEQICPPEAIDFEKSGMGDCIRQNGLSVVERYHPASHYWPLQLIETGIFVIAGLVLLAFSVWYVMRRIE
jgi:hypothetical protein